MAITTAVTKKPNGWFPLASSDSIVRRVPEANPLGMD